MPRFPRIFGRKALGAQSTAAIAEREPLESAEVADPAGEAKGDLTDIALVATADEPVVTAHSSPTQDVAPMLASEPVDTPIITPVIVSTDNTVPEPSSVIPEATEPESVETPLTEPEPPAMEAAPIETPPQQVDRKSSTEKSWIGGEEADLVPVIANTEIESHGSQSELDEGDLLAAAVEQLQGACEVAVARVNVIRKLQDGNQIISSLIALVGELDTRYTNDWGVVRRNGLEDVLVAVRDSIVEGDRFILESLENGRGGLTAEVFLRDLRTVAPADRPRMIANYALFLVLVIKCVLRQYLHPLAGSPTRQREVSKRLDYLMDGVRDTLIARINSIPRSS